MRFFKELKIFTKTLFSSYNLQSQITREVERARNEELRLDRKIDDEIARAKSEEKRIETKLNKEIDRSTQEDEDIHDELDSLKDDLKELEDSVDSNMSITIAKGIGTRNSLNGRPPQAPGEWEIDVREFVTADAKSSTQATLKQLATYVVAAPAQTFTVDIDTGMFPYGFATAAQHAATGDSVAISNLNYMGFGSIVSQTLQEGYEGNPCGTPKGHHLVVLTINGPWAVGDPVVIQIETIGYIWLNNFDKDPFPEYDINALPPKIVPLPEADVYPSAAAWASRLTIFP